MVIVPDRINVLLAEDDENDAILIRRAFETIGCVDHLHTVRDGEEVLAFLQDEQRSLDISAVMRPDIVILDHRMPKLSGLGVLYWLRTNSRYASIPVLLFSLALLPAEAEAVERLQAAWCVKPVAPNRTLAALRRGIQDAYEVVAPVRQESEISL